MAVRSCSFTYARAMDDLSCRPIPATIIDLAKLIHVFNMSSLSERGYLTGSVHIIFTVVMVMWKEMGGTSVLPAADRKFEKLALTPHA
jgi:hypothetical protein